MQRPAITYQSSVVIVGEFVENDCSCNSEADLQIKQREKFCWREGSGREWLTGCAWFFTWCDREAGDHHMRWGARLSIYPAIKIFKLVYHLPDTRI